MIAKLGLQEDYELLAKLKGPVGHKFKARQERIINALTKRNASISAHGLTPLLEEDYQMVRDTLVGFMEEVSGKIKVDLKLPQFPTAGILATVLLQGMQQMLFRTGCSLY